MGLILKNFLREIILKIIKRHNIGGDVTMGKGDDWEVLADFLEKNDPEDVSVSVDHDGKTIIMTNNEDETVFIDATEDGIKVSSAPFEKNDD